ncbi:MAG: hypothetical protein JWL69_756, partial [Phycisphaerales bacterium]|nr:hypothetical protein [Phycisphaerales bacterium]
MLSLRAFSMGTLAVGMGVVGPAILTRPAFAQPAVQSAADYVPRSMDELEQLAAPVALYPDAVLAQVLVASTYPDDVISASQWLSAGNDPSGIDSQNWDASVKGIARFPDVLNYLAGHFDWMNELGDTFLNQQADVMSAVQSLRAQAVADGNLASTDQQQVIPDGDVIEIVPADPQVIYVPQYDPQVVYVERPYYVGGRWTPLIRFGRGISVGGWLHHDVDWDDRAVYYGDWGRDRPWWRHEDRRGDEGHRYAEDRPGTYRSTNITNVRNTTIINNRTDVRNNVTNEQPGRWQRDAQKPAPRPAARPEGRAPNQRAGTGYPAADRPAAEPPRNVAVPDQTHGSVTARASNRGQTSRTAAAPHQTAQPAARPATPAPRAAERPAPEPAARPAPQP